MSPLSNWSHSGPNPFGSLGPCASSTRDPGTSPGNQPVLIGTCPPPLSSGCLRGSLELCPTCDPRLNSTRLRSRAPVLFGTHRGYRSVSRTPQTATAAARRTGHHVRTSARASMSVWCRVSPAPISKPEPELQGVAHASVVVVTDLANTAPQGAVENRYHY